MCLIVHSKDGKLLPRDAFDYARSENPDGIGIMSSRGVRKFMGPRAGKRAWRHLRELSDGGVAYGLHFRWATHGAVTLANCHPFRAEASDALVMHNGILDTAKDATPQKSDTALFVERFLAGAPSPEDAESEAYYKLISDLIGYGNKLLIFHVDTSAFTLCNEDLGEWIGGLWYSNTYSLPRTMRPTRFVSAYSSGYTYGFQRVPPVWSREAEDDGDPKPLDEIYSAPSAPSVPYYRPRRAYRWNGSAWLNRGEDAGEWGEW